MELCTIEQSGQWQFFIRSANVQRRRNRAQQGLLDGSSVGRYSRRDGVLFLRHEGR